MYMYIPTLLRINATTRLKRRFTDHNVTCYYTDNTDNIGYEINLVLLVFITKLVTPTIPYSLYLPAPSVAHHHVPFSITAAQGP